MVGDDYKRAYALLRYDDTIRYGLEDDNIVRPDGNIFEIEREALGAAVQSFAMRELDDPLSQPFYWRCGVAEFRDGKFVYNLNAIPF